jgi:L,D-transpeptidase ErfK/SrfK
LNIFRKQTQLLLFGGVVFICILFCSNSSWALRSYITSPDSTLYDVTRWVKVNENDTLLDIARDFDLGYNQIISANQNVDPWLPPKESLVCVPLAFVLPQECTRSGIVINLPEMRIYYFLSEGGHDFFFTAPIGIGTEGFLTKIGTYKVKSKTPNPTWVVPVTIREEEPDLPDKVPPGPDNPLGDFIFRLSKFEYGIHGTNKPWGVGRRVSHGCIRLYPEDICALYPIVPVGTDVQVIYEPIKVGWADGKCWIQVFEDFVNPTDNQLSKALSGLSRCETAIGHLEVNFAALDKALKEKTGVPTEIARLKEF